MPDRLSREVADVIRGAFRTYRVTWAPDVHETIAAFDLRDAHRLAHGIAENSHRTGGLEAAYPVRIQEIETGRAWRFERRGVPKEEPP